MDNFDTLKLYMPLLTGPGNIRKNVQELMKPMQSASRKKAVATISTKHNISRSDAQMKQAIAIAKNQSRKK